MADVFAKLVKDGGPIGQHMNRAHGYFTFPKLEGELGSRMFFRGKERIVWSLNNYLGLANHPEVREADTAAAANWGMGYPMYAFRNRISTVLSILNPSSLTILPLPRPQLKHWHQKPL